MKLRPYQEHTFNEMLKWVLETKKNNLCVDMPTGSGKSHVIAYTCKYFLHKWPSTRILMLTHVKELLEQNLEKMIEYWPNAPVGMYSASVGQKVLGEPITFAGVLSIVNRLEDIGLINVIIIDECHLISHKDDGSYRKIINHLRKLNPRMKVIGFTATPYRLGHGYIDAGEALFDDIIKPVNVIQLIRDGFLSPLKCKATDHKIDASNVQKRGGEYIESALQKVVDTSENNTCVVDEIIKRAIGRQSWLIFCTGVDHALSVRDVLIEKGVKSACITGSTNKTERARIIDEFKNGQIKALTNANVLTTGFDAPNVDLIALLRPTMSTALHIQKLGRGTRLKTSGAEDCLILDFVGNIMKHGGLAAPMIESEKQGSEDDLKEPRENDGAPMKPCPECHEIVHISCKACTDCGFEFPIKEEPKGAGGVGIGKPDETVCPITGLTEEDESTVDVRSWKWSKHVSKTTQKNMLKCSYFGKLHQPPIVEYHLVQHGGSAEIKAIRKIKDILEKCGSDFSGVFKHDDLEDAARYINVTSMPPKKITYRKNGYFYEVIDRSWGNDVLKKKAIEMKKSGVNAQEIADKFKVSRETITKWTKGVEPNANKKKQAIKLKKSGVKIADIAKQLNCPVWAVKEWAKDVKSPLRKNS